MFTRVEEDITVLEIEEKNTGLFMEWLKGKEGKRNVRDSEQVGESPEGAIGPEGYSAIGSEGGGAFPA